MAGESNATSRPPAQDLEATVALGTREDIRGHYNEERCEPYSAVQWSQLAISRSANRNAARRVWPAASAVEAAGASLVWRRNPTTVAACAARARTRQLRGEM